MPSFTIQLVVRLFLGLVACTTPERDERAATTTSAPATQSSAEYSLQFALVPPLDDDATNDDPYERRLAARASALIESAQPDRNDDTRNRRILEAVHFLLSRRCEPALSRILLDIAEESDGPTITSAATSAATLLDELSESAGDQEQSWENGLDPELLAAVADALAAIGAAGTMPDDADPGSRGRLVNASIQIAPFLDDQQPDISALARLLQGACYRRAGQPSRAADVLLPTGNTAALPYDLFNCVEYCRALCDQGQFVAAWTLAMEYEVRPPGRMPIEHRTSAAHTFRHLRWSIGRQWSEHLLESAADEAAVERSQALADRLKRSFGAQAVVTLYRLGHVLPKRDDAGVVQRPKPINR